MGRSVSTPSNAAGIVFLHDVIDSNDPDAWYYFLDDPRDIIPERYKSFRECDIWLGREDHGILLNDHAIVTISEYGGVTAICLVPSLNVDHPELAQAWCDQVVNHFTAYIESRYPTSVMRQTGRMSNGIAVYRRVN